MMTVKELIEKLAEQPSDALVYVWGGYNSCVITDEFSVEIDEDGDVVLEP